MQANSARRNSLRCPGYDYTQPGAYFVTLVAYEREPLFGAVMDGSIRLNEIGEIAAKGWLWLEHQYPCVTCGTWVLMPNHFHAILRIGEDSGENGIPGRGGSRTAPTPNGVKTKSLGRLIGAFKTVSSKQINLLRQTPGCPVWQRNFYDHIIRDQADFERIQEYILTNPVRWESDRFYR